MEQETKVCSTCGLERPIEHFNKIFKTGKKRRARCRLCRRPEHPYVSTGFKAKFAGLEGNTLEERAEIRANYLRERAKKEAIEDAMRIRVQRGLNLETNRWVRNALGIEPVEVLRSRVFRALPILVKHEQLDFIDDHLEMTEG